MVSGPTFHSGPSFAKVLYKQLNDEVARDGRAKKYTNKIYRDNHIHYTDVLS